MFEIIPIAAPYGVLKGTDLEVVFDIDGQRVYQLLVPNKVLREFISGIGCDNFTNPDLEAVFAGQPFAHTCDFWPA